MRRIAWFVGGVTMAATAGYVFVYLYRWEWHRALFVAVVFLATEMAMATALILRRLAQQAEVVAEERTPRGRAVDPAVAARLREAAPTHDRFAWLVGDLSRTNVFITILLGGGAVVSAGAWVLDKLAGRTASPVLERSLAQRLGELSLPEGGLVASDDDLVAAEDHPSDDPAIRLLVGPLGMRP